MSTLLLEILLFITVIICIYIVGMIMKFRLLGMSTLEMIIVFIVIVIILKRIKN